MIVIPWLKAFSLTLVVEVALVMWLVTAEEPSRGRRLGAAAFAQLASHPIVWFVMPSLPTPWTVTLVIAECWAVGSELLIYRLAFPRLAWLRAFGVSALANGASFALGLLVRHTLGWV